MAKKHEHEDHVNHEAWAIPYGDLVTLLLAFFVVMYATSSVNEGKYKVLSDSLNAAFRGAPRTMEPIAIGDKPAKTKGDDTVAGIKPGQVMKLEAEKAEQQEQKEPAENAALQGHLQKMSDDLRNRDAGPHRPGDDPHQASTILGRGRNQGRHPASRAAAPRSKPRHWPSSNGSPAILAERPYPIRIEGHTDTRPIKTSQFPSNWELSAARAARIVRLFEGHGIDSGPDGRRRPGRKPAPV